MDTPLASPSTPAESVFSTDSITRMSNTELLQAELRERLNNHRRLEILRTPDVPLEPEFNKEKVAEWLKVKGFNDSVVQRVAALGGHTVLALRKHDLHKLLDKVVDDHEISRLDSQIKIQRANHPFNTVGTAEFKAVLAKARRKAEKALAEHDEDETPETATNC